MSVPADTAAVEPHDESQYPKRWDWKTEGPTVEGTYVRMDQGRTAFGKRAILVLLVAGEERSIWLNEQSLHGQIQDELRDRRTRDFDPGERIRVHREPTTRQSKLNPERTTRPTRVTFLDHQQDAASILGVDDEPSTTELEAEPAQTAPPVGDDSDLPY